jgi:hypothetical protein
MNCRYNIDISMRVGSHSTFDHVQSSYLNLIHDFSHEEPGITGSSHTPQKSSMIFETEIFLLYS